MRIKKIKLAGFKSFVDPTTIPLSDNLVGIVGPNGCGKSNVIDAVRWVMGESSAKHLRGESMADVIFSGSSARKPVGRAAVEIVFDNSDGRAPGEYARYAELAIRREAARDGQSDYFINKTKCRRKDITDIFLGTGLGPRAYSIIEQGMVTRIIEAKPEDLRAFFEEAAGISRYKERRRETENRIKHTRENLARVEDIRKELETQINRLQRQAKAAGKYKEYKQQERLLRAQLLSLRLAALAARLQQHDSELTAQEIALQAAIAGQREIEAAIEQHRSGQIEANDRFNAVQAQFYATGAEINNIEQAIQHARETHQQRVREQEQLQRAWQEASHHLEQDEQQHARLEAALTDIEPRLASARDARAAAAAALQAAEQVLQQWQTQWAQFTQRAQEPAKVRDVQRARIQQLERHLGQLRQRGERLAGEAQQIQSQLNDDALASLRTQAETHERECDSHSHKLEQLESEINVVQAHIRARTDELNVVRGRHQNAEARMASLRELQAAALGKYDEELNTWLQQRALTDAPRLAKLLQVEPGWEKAVERILGGDLGAVCVSNLDELLPSLSELRRSELVVFDLDARCEPEPTGTRAQLHDKVRAQVDLASLFSGVFVAEDLTEAMTMRQGLAAHESVVTRSGVWMGRNWLALTEEEGAQAGMLARERELQAVGAECAADAQTLSALQDEVEREHATAQALEATRAEHRRLLNDLQRARAALHAQLGHKEAQRTQFTNRLAQVEKERGEIATQMAHDDSEIAGARTLLAEADTQATAYEREGAELNATRDELRRAHERTRTDAQTAAETLHRLEMERQTTQTTLASTRQSIERLQSQLKDLLARRAQVEELLAREDNPEQELKRKLETLLQRRVTIEQDLSAARSALAELDNAVRAREQARGEQEVRVQAVRERLEQERLARQELAVRRDTFNEQIRESGYDADALAREMPPELTEEGGQTELDELLKRIDRLGPINLMAISEFEEQSQRKGYIDKQYEDLSQALATLEEAIRKIDRETRTRFKETFDKVNTGFQAIYPRLFGGGHAYLELVGDDLLDTGVTVMARPPGKRNSTIHLLSGGEKALTAVSLLFAIFELNPAPFCLLDEVDAPLDDANVERYAQTLKVMSQHTQLIFITHNKLTMEVADVLMGVTMSEPGVSRLVAVDVEEAMEMVAQ